jgi:hypothetical protein
MKRFENCPFCEKEMRSSPVERYIWKGEINIEDGESDCYRCRLFTDFDENDTIVRIEFQRTEWNPEEFTRIIKIMNFK